MTLSTVAPTAGWFPDPGDPAQERWWSGEAWTEHHRQVAGVPASPTTPVDTHPTEPAQSDYVFDMTAQQTPAAPVDDVATPAPTRPTLPTFQELLAAAAAPSPDTFEGAPAPAPELAMPAYEPLAPKSYGAPAAEAAPAEPAPGAHRHEVAPILPVALEAPTALAAPALPTLPSAAPVFTPQPELTPQPAFTPQPVFTPQPEASVSVAPQPLALPVDPGFVLPTQPSAPSLVMPSAPILETTAPRAEQAARHAGAAEVLPSVPTAPAAPAPVGYTSSADVAVANRYRAALHAPEPEEVEPPNPFGAALGPYPTALAPAGSPSQPGWQGMPLPGAGAAFSPNMPVPGSYAPPIASDGHNKTAWTALGSGALAIGLAVFFLFFDRIGLWPGLLAIAAVVQGIVGAARSRKAGSGMGASVGAIVLGVVALAIMVTSVVSWTL